MKGQIIVFEGIDGSGKSTQTDLLLTYLKKRKISTKYYKFPQYKKTIYGRMVGDFLSGKLGSLENINPYLISLPYALDRASVADQIKREKAAGNILVFDRYVASTKGHQASRLNGVEQKQFLEWQDKLEYGINKMPKEDLVFLLDLPVKNSLELIDNRQKDLLEQKELQEKTRQIYLSLAQENPKRWVLIDCLENGKLKSKNQIHQEIVEIMQQRKLI